MIWSNQQKLWKSLFLPMSEEFLKVSKLFFRIDFESDRPFRTIDRAMVKILRMKVTRASLTGKNEALVEVDEIFRKARNFVKAIFNGSVVEGRQVAQGYNFVISYFMRSLKVCNKRP